MNLSEDRYWCGFGAILCSICVIIVGGILAWCDPGSPGPLKIMLVLFGFGAFLFVMFSLFLYLAPEPSVADLKKKHGADTSTVFDYAKRRHSYIELARMIASDYKPPKR